ncbi:MAG TPA: helix-turn-helix transcriptional regulator, partial [Brevundimonas sp.]
RQEQCLRLTAFRTDKEIAAHLGISEATVKKHVHEACQRLGVNRRKAALALLDPTVTDVVEKASIPRVPDYPKQPVARAAVHEHSSLDGAQHVEKGLVEGRTGWPDAALGRRGYRAPPANPLVRIILIIVVTIVLAALVVTLVGMLGDMHEAVGRIDAASTVG